MTLNDPIVGLHGEGWDLVVSCPWEAHGPGIRTGWLEADEIHESVWDLAGLEIVSMTAGPDVVDPVFHLTGGVDLSVHADGEWDPWTLSTPDLIFVAPA